MASSHAYSATIRLQFLNPEHALLAKRVLEVDDELQPDRAARSLSVSGSELVATLTATEAKVLRVTVSSFFDAAATVSRTLAEFT